jgi:hypothetical protein
VPAGLDQRPGPDLRRRGRGVGAPEPVGDGGMKGVEYVHGVHCAPADWLMS